jgi:hypothetical protein
MVQRVSGDVDESGCPLPLWVSSDLTADFNYTRKSHPGIFSIEPIFPFDLFNSFNPINFSLL